MIDAKQIGTSDWFWVDWREVWEAHKLRPIDVPGVMVNPRNVNLYQVHLTHLSLLGCWLPNRSVQPINDAALILIAGLKPHQADGVAYIRNRRGTLLADEMRVGKTATTMYAHEPQTGCMFVVGPLAARAVWHEWAARRFGICANWRAPGTCSICDRVHAVLADKPEPSFTALEGRKLDDEQLRLAMRSRVVFCHFAVVPTWRELFATLKIGTLVVDECHLPQAGMQNRKSVTSESIRYLNTVAKRAVFLSGSPLWNKPKGLWPILDTITPGAFGDFWSFARRYCDAKPTGYGWQANGASREVELAERLKEVMLRRRWIDVAKNLPPITRAIEIVSLSDDQRDRVEETAARIRSTTTNTQTIVGDLARMRKLYAKEKMKAAAIKAREAILDGHSAIVWTHHREVAEALARDLDVNVCVTGDLDPLQREEIIEDARNASASRPVMLIATMGALATAVNLSFADVEIFCELDWNPDSIAQAEMRPYNGTRPIQAIFLVADVEVEQRLADALLEKLQIKDRLGVAAGVGSVAEVLQATLGIEDVRTLSALADAVLAEAAL